MFGVHQKGNREGGKSKTYQFEYLIFVCIYALLIENFECCMFTIIYILLIFLDLTELSATENQKV